jgi:hypothetical protein
MSIRNRLTAGLAAVTVAFALGACDDSSPSSPSTPGVEFPSTPAPDFQNNSRQFGLVNVSTGDIELLNNVNLAVAVNILATVCDATVGIAALAAQLVADGSFTECTTVVQDGITITQAQPGQNPGSGPNGGNNAQQAGLINIAVGDVVALNNLNAAVAANVLVTVCDLTVGAAILAVQAVTDAGRTVCTTEAGPIVIDQSQA